MNKIILILFTLLLLSSCFEFQNLDFKGVENVKFGKLNGGKITFVIDVKMSNPNNYTIKVKPSSVDLYVEESLLGKAFLDEKVKIIRKKEGVYSVPLRIDLEDGVMLKFFKFALMDKVKVRIKGKVKGSIFGVSKKIAIDEFKEIDGKNFKLGSFIGNE